MIGGQPTFKVVNGEFVVDNQESYELMLLRSFDTGVCEVSTDYVNDRLQIKAATTLGTDPVSGGLERVMIYTKQEQDDAKVFLDQLSQAMSFIATKPRRPWNKRVWYAVPALRQEPFDRRNDAIQAIRNSAKMRGQRFVEVIHFPSRWQARKLANKDLMPIERVDIFN